MIKSDSFIAARHSGGMRRRPRGRCVSAISATRTRGARSGVLGDGAGLEAAAAAVDAQRAPALVDPDLLQVRAEPPPSGDHRVAPRVPERGLLSAAVTDLGHRRSVMVAAGTQLARRSRTSAE